MVAVSESLIEEVRDVLLRPKFRKYLPEEAIPPAIRRIVDAATLAEEGEVEPILDDPKDDYLVALALASGADVIVSGDRHLSDPPRELPVRVLRPAAFMEELNET
jgi:putative PIN family toxin of toxin-antitoxin system